MNIQAEKIELMKMILETDNPSIIHSINQLFRKDAEVDFWKTLELDEKEEILKGIAQIGNGDVVDYNDFINKHR